SSLNSYITVSEEQALEQAKAADARRAAGNAGPLTGVPFAHKDIFCTDGIRTTCASRMLENFVPPYNSTVAQKLLDAGAVCLGKTNMDEFAMGSSNETSYFGAVKNPWELSRVSGGSSGGSAAAVAARQTPFATGTDTGGSLRQPAAICGLTGLKPTYGRVTRLSAAAFACRHEQAGPMAGPPVGGALTGLKPTYGRVYRLGVVAFASSLDQAGPMARTAEDAALMLQAMAGFDPKDSTCAERDVPDYLAALNQPLDGLRIGLPKEYF